MAYTNGAGSGRQLFCYDQFVGFDPLLLVSEDYARYSGCRFRKASFDGLDREAATSKNVEPASHFGAKLRAAPAVQQYTEILRSGKDQALVRELYRANDIVLAESTRRSMIATCKEVDMWPPKALPYGMLADGGGYDDPSAPVPVIAWRLYNSEVRRKAEASCGVCREDQQAMTAMFIVDFAHEVGAPMPRIPAPVEQRIFESRVLEWHLQEIDAKHRGELGHGQDWFEYLGGVVACCTTRENH
mmetsp:Transcript_84218/g.234931  ORF Transcript_84218/g.234931 Transcript_84218/m.234931 type:complete len:244 (-) Transcript_84218:70-801(-)